MIARGDKPIGHSGKKVPAVVFDRRGKKIGDQWIVKSVDLRDEATRNKTRFSVTAAALRQTFPSTVLDPLHLSEVAAIPSDLVTLRSQ